MVIAVVKGNFEVLFTRRKKPASARVSKASGVSLLPVPDTGTALPKPYPRCAWMFSSAAPCVCGGGRGEVLDNYIIELPGLQEFFPCGILKIDHGIQCSTGSREKRGRSHGGDGETPPGGGLPKDRRLPPAARPRWGGGLAALCSIASLIPLPADRIFSEMRESPCE